MCTRIFWSTNKIAKVSSRTMDWEFSDDPKMWIHQRDSVRTDPYVDHPHTWTSSYGSVSLSAWDKAVSDGMNEAGLASHTLYLEQTRYEERDDRPGVSTLLWSQFLLDTCSTVNEAIARMSEVQIVSAKINGRHLGLHVALEDSSGDSAIIEFIDGEQQIHHGPEFQVMANDPDFDQQLTHRMKYRPFGGDLPPPGDITSLDRFVRASYYLHYLAEPENISQSIAGVLHLARNVAVPYGAPYGGSGTYPTWWTTVCDVTNRTYCFESTLSPNLIWVELPDIDFGSSESVHVLDPRAPSLVGDVLSAFEPAESQV